MALDTGCPVAVDTSCQLTELQHEFRQQIGIIAGLAL